MVAQMEATKELSTTEFFQTVFGQCEGLPGKIVLLENREYVGTDGKPRTTKKVVKCFAPERLEAAAEFAEGRPDLYAKINLCDIAAAREAISPRTGKPNTSAVGGADHVTVVPGFAFDIDAGKGKYPSHVDTLAIFDAMGYPPTLLIHSDGDAGGFYPWYLLDEPFAISSEDGRDEIKTVSRRLLDYVNQQLGFKYDATFGVERNIRCPGSTRKNGNSVTAFEFGPRYQIDQIRGLLLPETERPAIVKRDDATDSIIWEYLDSINLETVEDVLAHFDFDDLGGGEWRRPNANSSDNTRTGVVFEQADGRRGFTCQSCGFRDDDEKDFVLVQYEWYCREALYGSLFLQQSLVKHPDRWKQVSDWCRAQLRVSAEDEFSELDAEALGVEVLPSNPVKSKSQSKTTAQPNTVMEVGSRNLKKLPPETVAAAIAESFDSPEGSTLRRWDGYFWQWSKGRYELLRETAFKEQVTKILQRHFRNISTGAVANVLLNLAGSLHVPDVGAAPFWIDGGPSWDREDIFVTQDQVIHLPTFVLGVDGYSVHTTPNFFSTVAIDYRFDEHAPEPRKWNAFLVELFDDDTEAVQLLQEWCGYLLTCDTRQQKILLMIGPPRSGKGTIARVMHAILGEKNCCAPSLNRLAERFGLSQLIGKSAAFIGDLRLPKKGSHASLIERLLGISGQDAQTIERKYKDEFSTTLHTRLTILSNEQPRFHDPSGALANRFLVLQFNRSFLGNENPNLTAELLQERTGILLWAIEGWSRLRDRGHFVQPTSGKEISDELAEGSNPVLSFLADCCDQSDPQASVDVSDLHRDYLVWGQRNNVFALRHYQPFKEALAAALGPDRVQRVQVGGKRTRKAIGVQYVIPEGFSSSMFA